MKFLVDTAMSNWKSKKIIKAGRASRTVGKQKGDTCHTDVQKKFFACHPHAYRLQPKRYKEWHDKFVKMTLSA